AFLGSAPVAAQATNPERDLKEFRDYYMEKFPGMPLQRFADGIYGISKERRKEWKEMEEFPPYEIGLDIGKEEFFKKLPSGKSLADCFPGWKQGVRQDYPYFDKQTGKIVTLEGTINKCRTDNGAEPYRWGKGKIAAVSAWIGYNARGNEIDVEIPNDPKAMQIYERGKGHFYARRGQLNFACADCHMYQAGVNLRANLLSPALGQVSHFPVYRKKWEARGSGPLAGFGTLHRRYGGCNRRVRAADFSAQGEEYKALEYFHTYMSNGIKVNAPGVRQ
ncbi:MAG: sulfur oxidation c-type cytochrome SoxA, partial [Gammaproteobacteria bacterium]|nr:sulfur oxidation c-type cytochrome SoxA [Gammaproteobacteria bacterium]